MHAVREVIKTLLGLVALIFIVALAPLVGVGAGIGVFFSLQFLTVDLRFSFTIGMVTSFALGAFLLHILWMGGPDDDERNFSSNFFRDRAKVLALEAVRPAFLSAGVLVIALVAADGARRTGAPVSMKEWGNGWGEVWFSSTVVAMFVVTWPAALAGNALNYLQAAREVGRLTDRKRTGTGQGAGRRGGS